MKCCPLLETTFGRLLSETEGQMASSTLPYLTHERPQEEGKTRNVYQFLDQLDAAAVGAEDKSQS